METVAPLQFLFMFFACGVMALFQLELILLTADASLLEYYV